MKTSTRLTKAAVLEEVNQLRKRMNEYANMSGKELLAEYNAAFPGSAKLDASREFCIFVLLKAATYHMTNVLNLE